MSKKRKFKVLKTILPLALGIFFIYYSLHNFSVYERQELLKNILNINPLWVILSVLGGLLSHLSRAYRWRILLRPLGYHIPVSTAFMAIMGGYLANLGIPRSGEVLRGALVATYEKASFDKVFGTIITERAIDVIIVLLILSITLLLHATELFTFLDEYHINPWITLVGILMLIFIGIGFLILVKRSRLSIFEKIRSFVSGILQGVKSVFKIENKAAFIFHTFFIWIMYILTFYVLKFAFLDMEGLNFSALLVAFMAGSFSVSITNGGIGIYPIAVGGALALFGLQREIGEAFGWVDWGTQTLLSILLGGISLVVLPFLSKKREMKGKDRE